MAKIRFSAEEDELLIELVSSHEYLWDMKHQDFKNIHKKDKVWQEIAEMVNKTRAECQKRWKSIRDHYKRQRKEDKGRTGSAAKKKRANYWDRLAFLDTVEDERDTFSNIAVEKDPEVNQLDSSMEATCSSTKENETPSCQPEQTSQSAVSQPLVSKKRRENSAIAKYLTEKKDQNAHFNNCIKELMKPEEQDDIDLFFKSIAMTVKKFRPELVTKTKMKVFQIVTDMEVLQQKGVDTVSYDFRCRENNPPSYRTSVFSPSSAYNSELSNPPSNHSSLLSSSPAYHSELSNPPSRHSSELTSFSNYRSDISHTNDIVNEAFQYALNP